MLMTKQGRASRMICGVFFLVLGLCLLASHFSASTIRSRTTASVIRCSCPGVLDSFSLWVAPSSFMMGSVEPNFCCSECAGRVSFAIQSCQRRIAERFR
jgi:hypothetical protein